MVGHHALAALPFMFICCFWLVGAVVGLGLLVFWILVLIDCLKNERSEGNDKIVWVLVIVLAHWIGALIYLLVRRPERKRLYGK